MLMRHIISKAEKHELITQRQADTAEGRQEEAEQSFPKEFLAKRWRQQQQGTENRSS
jgi:hypothetical protein